MYKAMALCLALASAAIAAEPVAKTNWERVAQIRKDQKVTIRLHNGDAVKGLVQEAGPEGLILIQNKRSLNLRREEIHTITVTSRARGALWGFAIAGGLGAGLGAAAAGKIVDRNNPTGSDRAGAAAGFGLVFGGIAAAVGAAAGTERTLYRAP